MSRLARCGQQVPVVRWRASEDRRAQERLIEQNASGLLDLVGKRETGFSYPVVLGE